MVPFYFAIIVKMVFDTYQRMRVQGAPPPSPIPLPMDIFLKIPTDWISYTKQFLKELRDKYTSTWELTQPLLDILIRIPYIKYMIDHQANPKQDYLNSLPTKVSCYFCTIIISHCKSEITTVSRKVFQDNLITFIYS